MPFSSTVATISFSFFRRLVEDLLDVWTLVGGVKGKYQAVGTCATNARIVISVSPPFQRAPAPASVCMTTSLMRLLLIWLRR